MNPTFRDITDLLAHLGCADLNDLQRRVYKTTECGAWVALEAPGRDKCGMRAQTWAARINNGILGPRVVSVRRKGRRAIDPTTAPAYVRDFLLMNPDNRMRLDWSDLPDRPTDYILSVTTAGSIQRIVTFKVDAPIERPHAGGVRLGSIVEGSDAEVAPVLLRFPFTPDQWEAAIEAIEDEADRLWREENSTENDDRIEYDRDGHPI